MFVHLEAHRRSRWSCQAFGAAARALKCLEAPEVVKLLSSINSEHGLNSTPPCYHNHATTLIQCDILGRNGSPNTLQRC
jgi:hypothetical protein